MRKYYYYLAIIVAVIFFAYSIYHLGYDDGYDIGYYSAPKEIVSINGVDVSENNGYYTIKIYSDNISEGIGLITFPSDKRDFTNKYGWITP